jgi:hypothetical protein
MNAAGKILYEGRVAFSGKGPYQVLPAIIEGPLVDLPGPTGCVISFETQVPAKTSVTVNGKAFGDEQETMHHEITITGLLPGKSYDYTVQYGERSDKHTLKTAPEAGSRKPFTFGFVADNRSVVAGGEREFGQTNYQVARAGMAAAVARNISFLQAMGGQTTGNNPSTAGHMLEYANYKRALEPFWSTTPVYVGMGMWYDGKNDMRPNIMGVPTEKGIIERRDQLIDVAINHSKKVIGFLVGSEHNFAMLEVTPDLDLYPKAYAPAKLKVNRKFFYIQNGGGGAYAYALMNNNPWMDKFKFLTAPPSMALFHVNGPSVTLEAFNPETFEKICEDVKLR